MKKNSYCKESLLELDFESMHLAYEYDLCPEHQDFTKNIQLLWQAKIQNSKSMRRFKNWDFDSNIEPIATHIHSAWEHY